jgi:hypothetical protein
MKKHRKPLTPAATHPRWWLWAVAAAAVVFVVGGLTVLLTSPSRPADGTPKVVVDQTMIDEGYQKLDKAIRTSFTLRNEGDAPLRILGEPQVALVEGC